MGPRWQPSLRQYELVFGRACCYKDTQTGAWNECLRVTWSFRLPLIYLEVLETGVRVVGLEETKSGEVLARRRSVHQAHAQKSGVEADRLPHRLVVISGR